jgi:DNA polymerase I-like protein with 3'-5' exonuclease and polymerase domains
LWSLIQLNRHLREHKFNTKIIGQIHDSIIFDVHPPELETLKKQIRQVMTIDIRIHWNWIIVPLDIEADITEIDRPWFEKKPEKI